ncbi:MAG: cation:proton antiporter regulatory subunit [Paenisporosarcina sp.]
MNIRECDLPGIGRKFETITNSKDKVVIVIHDDGRREMYHYDEDDYDESISSVTFNDSEARQIASILGGMVYKPKALETIELAFDDLVIEWFKVEEGAQILGKTIGEIDIRSNYSINVIAIMKKNKEKLFNPGPDANLAVGDMVIISGERKNVKKAIKDLFSTGGG